MLIYDVRISFVDHDTAKSIPIEGEVFMTQKWTCSFYRPKKYNKKVLSF